MYSYIAKSVFNDHLGSSNDPFYIQNRVITNRVIKRLRCNSLLVNYWYAAQKVNSDRRTEYVSFWLTQIDRLVCWLVS